MGTMAEARALLSDYLDYLEALQPAVGLGDESERRGIRGNHQPGSADLELGTLLHRIDSNLDFFGNPAGVGAVAFVRGQPDRIPARDRSVHSHSLPGLLAELRGDEPAGFAGRVHAGGGQAQVRAGRHGGGLQPGADGHSPAESGIGRDRHAHRERCSHRLALLEQQLLARAEQNVEDRHKVPFWKKALGVLSVVADLVPVGQPVVGKIGAGLGLLAQIDPDHPVQSAKSTLTNAIRRLQEQRGYPRLSHQLDHRNEQRGGHQQRRQEDRNSRS